MSSDVPPPDLPGPKKSAGNGDERPAGTGPLVLPPVVIGALEEFGPAAAASPFVGLRPFDSSEALLFFGRDEQTAALLQRLHLTRFLAVVGSSGCGKSSLIRAGLIPKLKAGFLVGQRDHWRVVKLKPGNSPRQNLAVALLEAFGESAEGETLRALVNELEEAGVGAVTDFLSARLGGAAANVLLLVDQFEEIFRFGSYTDDADPTEDPYEREQRREEARDFVSVMLGLTLHAEPPVYAVLTMRSDFLGDCDVFPGLPEAMNSSQYLVPRLARAERLEAIECPVRLCGQSLTLELLHRVLDDMGEDPDQLPVMQHALLRTWENWQQATKGLREKVPVGVKHYENVGTIREALSRDADAALEGMSVEELRVTRLVFQALVETDAKGRRLRRPVRLSEAAAIAGAGREEILEIVGRFRGHNRSFLTLSDDRLKGDPLIDISHESLIRQWGALGEWVDAEVKSRELYLRLAEDAVRHCKREAPLWSDPALQLALDWWEGRRPNRAWARRYHPRFTLAKGFLRRSLRKRVRDDAEAERLRDEAAQRERAELEKEKRFAEDKQRQAEELADARAEKQRKAEEVAAARAEQLATAEALVGQQKTAARRQRWLIMVLLVFSVFMLAATGYAVYANREARKSRDEAQASRATAEEKERVATELAKRLSDSVAGETKAKEDAINQRDEAEKQKREADKQKTLADQQRAAALKSAEDAERARQAAEVARKDALHQAEIAEGAKKQAEDNLKLAKEVRKADTLRRDAGRLQQAARISQAEKKYIEAKDKYKELDDDKGVAYTYTEVAGMLITQEGSSDEAPARPERRGPPPDEGVDHEWVESHFLKNLPDAERFRAFEVSTEQEKGLAYFAEAVSAYRGLGRSDREDFNGSASAMSMVGNFLLGLETGSTQDEKLSGHYEALDRARAHAAVASFCAALGDYGKASNLDGQISMLTRMGDLLSDEDAVAKLSEGGDEDGDEDDAGVKGCDGQPVEPITYYSRAALLYEELLRQSSDDPAWVEEQKSKFVDLLVKAGKIYQEQEKPQQALESFERASKVYAGNVKKTAETLKDIADAANTLALKEQYYTRAADAYGQQGERAARADVLLYAGRRLSANTSKKAAPENRAAANTYLTEAVKIFDELGNADSKARALLTMGGNYSILRKPADAQKSYESILSLPPESTVKYRAETYYGLGTLHAQRYSTQKDKASLDAARASFETARRLYKVSPFIRPKIENALAELATLEKRFAAENTPEGEAPLQADAEIKLAGADIDGETPRGYAEYEVESDGDRHLIFRVEDVNLAGEVLKVLVDDKQVGIIALADEDVRGDLKLKSERKQTVPPVTRSTRVSITDKDGKVILYGSFADVAQPAPDAKRPGR
ncbi:MAG TPA: hypothetical protein VKB12_03955 [Pyrinomonadaceae bacterium]|nr:hypothetical protein [Pyrinomonadaceae bacterium]